MNIPKDEVQWKVVRYLRQGQTDQYDYTLILPEPLASWDTFDYWERERTESMRNHLTYGDTLFDIGAESGWLSAIYAKMVGSNNMVLFEPTKEFWPNIQSIFEKNGLIAPRAAVVALLSNKTTAEGVLGAEDMWPQESDGDLIDKNKYQYIHDNPDNVGELMLDDFINETGIIPDALTIDCEGAELLILQGSKETLTLHHPKVWVSIHPDLGLRDYGVAKDDTLRFMESLDYIGEHLATDHEEHWYFS